MTHISSKDDVWLTLSGTLREARQTRRLSQEQLAGRLGLRQRQISDLERARTDPRVSTVQNVARALDLELVLIPRELITAVESLRRISSGISNTRPMYALADEDVERDVDGPAPVEVGSTGEADRSPESRHKEVR